MDPHTLKMAQLKGILAQYQLSTSGRKAELIARMQEADPTGGWILEASQQTEANNDNAGNYVDPEIGASSQRDEADQRDSDNAHSRREIDLLMRERELMQREINLLNRENELLRASPGTTTSSTMSKATMSIKSIGELLNEYVGSNENFIQWKAQVNLIRNTYELDENATKILISSKLRGKAQEWYHSLADHLTLSVDMLLDKMDAMFNQPIGRLERRRQFEDRQWKRDETFSDYCHSKLILGNRVPIADDEMIDYLVEGIPSESLRNQAKIQSFPSVQALLTAFRKIKLSTTDVTARREYGGTKPNRFKNQESKTIQKGSDDSKSRPINRGVVRCYNCDVTGHYAKDCPDKKKKEGEKSSGKGASAPKERRADRQVGLIHNDKKHALEKTSEDDEQHDEDDEIQFIDMRSDPSDEFQQTVNIKIENNVNNSCLARIDTGCPITLIKEQLVKNRNLRVPGKEWSRFRGINNSKLIIKGLIDVQVTLDGVTATVTMGTVPDSTMSVPLLLGRDILKLLGYKLTRNPSYDRVVSEILNIDNEYNTSDYINTNLNVPIEYRQTMEHIFSKHYLEPSRPESPKVKMEATLSLKENKIVQFGPRRLGFAERDKVIVILDDLIKKGIIRESTSEYASPVVLTKKKNGEIRMCIDYRALNKILARDNYPLPLIEDQISNLRGKRFFSKCDLKNGFYHIAMSSESIKYTSFVTPMGQFEFLRLPFGLKIGPQLFQRFINEVLKDLIRAGTVIVYMDDILIATETVDEHLQILKQVFTALVQNKLELRLEKCSFLDTEVEYLGYRITKDGIRPNDRGIEAVLNFPEPKTTKEVHSFVGLTSYFRKFIKGFSVIAQPLNNLLKKDAHFNFGNAERNAFTTLKTKLTKAPILAIYDPKAYTELHCDASAQGFGAVLLQRQSNKEMHPVFYFSRRTTATESKYHSFELETLAIVYALRRFRIYLQGIHFTIVSDCSAVTQTLEKRDINARIARWSLELQGYDFKVVHRPGRRMTHVDALSRSFGVLVIEDNPFEWNLSILQSRDPRLKDLISKLELAEDPHYELRNGLIYKKHGGKALFVVPDSMEKHVLFRYHNEMGHIGSGKMIECIRRSYWFPKIREKCEEHVQNCLKCISFSPTSGKKEGYLHPIPKGNRPFDTLHIDHFGPVDKHTSLKKYIFLVVDAFSKFVRLFATKTTNSKEAIVYLMQYFQNYDKPATIISDRGTAFTSQDFETFLKKYNVCHIKIAVGSPQANGQAERINRVLAPCLAKLTDKESGQHWYKVLPEVEHAINNTVNRSTGKSPSQVVFGIDQRGRHNDQIRDFLSDALDSSRDLETIREQVKQRIQKSQQQQKSIYDAKRKTPRQYKCGDLVMIRNFESTPGISKKLIPQFRGPYEISKVLRNDRYIVSDPAGFQNSQKLYVGTWDTNNLRPWITPANAAPD